MTSDTKHPPRSSRSAHLRDASILRALTLTVGEFADGINLETVVCDLETPRPLRLGAVESLFRDRATDTHYGGIPALREAIAARTRSRYGLAYSADDVCVTIFFFFKQKTAYEMPK